MKFMRVKISGFFLTRLSTTGKFPAVEVKKGLPEGTRFCYSIPDVDYGVWIVVEHESFRELKDGEIIPIFKGVEIHELPERAPE